MSYAPSCQLLQFSRNQSRLFTEEHSGKSHLFAIQNPTQDLAFTDIEVETVVHNFNSHNVLKHEQANYFALKQQGIKINLEVQKLDL